MVIILSIYPIVFGNFDLEILKRRSQFCGSLMLIKISKGKHWWALRNLRIQIFCMHSSKTFI